MGVRPFNMRKYFKFNIGLIVWLIASVGSFAFGADRATYFAGMATSNFPADARSFQSIAVLCTVHVVNASNTTQRLTDFSMKFHVSQQSNSGANEYRANVDIRKIAHSLPAPNPSHSAFAEIANWVDILAWYKVGVTPGTQPHVFARESSARVPDFIQNQIGQNNMPRRTLKSARPEGILLAPGEMVVFMGRKFIDFSNTVVVNGVEVTNKKSYEFCSGLINVSDAPQQEQPKNGFVIASGQVEYLANSPLDKTMYYGEGADSLIRTKLVGYAHSVSPLTITVRSSLIERDANYRPYDKHIIAYQGTCGTRPELHANSRCFVEKRVSNLPQKRFPIRIASLSFLVNGGKPF